MVVFTLEAVIKIYALRLSYFTESWNVFDFLVVLLTIVILILSWAELVENLAVLGTSLRTLRIGRVFRLIKRARTIQVTFQTLIVSAPSIGSLGTLLIMLVFMFTVVGMQLFTMVKIDDQSLLSRHVNFQDFWTSFLTLLRCATGEGWNALMFDLSRQNTIFFQCQES